MSQLRTAAARSYAGSHVPCPQHRERSARLKSGALIVCLLWAIFTCAQQSTPSNAPNNGSSADAWSQQTTQAKATELKPVKSSKSQQKAQKKANDKVQSDIMSQIAVNNTLGDAEIHVSVTNDTVTLTGYVDGEDGRFEAENIARSCAGNRKVVNNIETGGAPIMGR